MPTKLLKNMKSMDIFCTSPSSTAICSSTTADPYTPTTVRHHLRSHHHRHSNRPIHHRVNSYLQDQYKNLASSTTTPKNCISDQLPITPRPRKTAEHLGGGGLPTSGRRKSSADVTDLLRRRRDFLIRRRSPSGGSSRYLLLGDNYEGDGDNNKAGLEKEKEKEKEKDGGDNEKLAIVPKKREDDNEWYSPRLDDVFDRSSSALALSSQPVRPVKDRSLLVKSSDHSSSSVGYDSDVRGNRIRSSSIHDRTVVVKKKPSRPPPPPPPHKSGEMQQEQEQVVVLRVSLHCKGCAGKLSKHLSKIKGVTSFSIELESKKVTVVVTGKLLTPADVLASVSKVKKAELWPSSSSSPSPSSTSTSSSSSSSSSSGRLEYFSY